MTATPAAGTPAPAAAAPAAPASTPAAAPAAPAAAAPAAPAAPASLLDGTTPAAPAAAAPAAPVAPVAPVNPNSPDAYLLAEGVQGAGKKPEWFKGDKYASVADQAKAYVALEQRFGAFVGAPPEGKYDLKMPEGAGVELVADHPLLGDFQKWAAAKHLSQAGFTELLGMLGQYEAQQVVDPAAVKTAIGENADARISAVGQWASANLDAKGVEALRSALVPGQHTAAVFAVIESVISKTSQKALPKPGSDVPAGQPSQLAAIQAKMGARDAKGNLKYMMDEKYRNDVEKELQDFYKAQAA